MERGICRAYRCIPWQYHHGQLGTLTVYDGLCHRQRYGRLNITLEKRIKMKVKLAVGSMQCTFHKATNLNKMLEMVDEAADHGANLLVLPESCLTGYLSTITHVHFDQLDDSKSE